MSLLVLCSKCMNTCCIQQHHTSEAYCRNMIVILYTSRPWNNNAISVNTTLPHLPLCRDQMNRNRSRSRSQTEPESNAASDLKAPRPASRASHPVNETQGNARPGPTAAGSVVGASHSGCMNRKPSGGRVAPGLPTASTPLPGTGTPPPPSCFHGYSSATGLLRNLLPSSR